MPPQRVAVIDCGTNTFNLLIAERRPAGWHFLCRRKKVVKLGAGGIRNGFIAEAPARRALKALTGYRETLDAYAVKRVSIVGTAALRDAVNGKILLKEIRKQTGFKIELIDGLREAELIWKGVNTAVDLGEETSLIMDIGGGSTEFIICNRTKILWKQSFRLGAARLLEQIGFSDPVKPTEIRRLNQLLTQELDSLLKACNRFEPVRLIGSSGSFDTFASLILKKEEKPALRGSHYRFFLPSYRALHKTLITSIYAERIKMPGMLRMRADMIVPASLLLTFVLRLTGLNDLHLSTYSLKEGLLSEIK